MSKESELKRLSEDQKELVLTWVNEGEALRAVVERIAKPEPEGFGVVTNPATLSRFVDVWREEQLLMARPIRVGQAEAFLLKQEEALRFQRATISVLQQRLFESAMECRRQREQRETLRMMLDYEVKMRRLDLAEKKFEEAKRQFEFNAARMTMKYWHQFKDIHERSNIDDEDKIWEARDVVFEGPKGEKSTVGRPNVVHKVSKAGEEICMVQPEATVKHKESSSREGKPLLSDADQGQARPMRK